jgi:hypothetical protein
VPSAVSESRRVTAAASLGEAMMIYQAQQTTSVNDGTVSTTNAGSGSSGDPGPNGG